MSDKQECYQCGGKGYIPGATGDIECYTCGGRGWKAAESSPNIQECYQCGGKGKVGTHKADERECPECGGRGWREGSGTPVNPTRGPGFKSGNPEVSSLANKGCCILVLIFCTLGIFMQCWDGTVGRLFPGAKFTDDPNNEMVEDAKLSKEDLQSLIESAENGDAEAQYNLGVKYDNGEGVPEDDKEAVKWLRKAAEQGNANAQSYLGVMYINGEGVPADAKEAVKWFRKAAEQGHTKGQSNLGAMYNVGNGVEKDLVTAYAWFDIAAGKGYQSAINNKSLIIKEMTPDQIAEAEALIKEMTSKNLRLLQKKE